MQTLDRVIPHPPETLPPPAEQRVVLHGISGATYEALLADNLDRRVPRLTYDRGVLELVSPLPTHELRKDRLSLLVTILAEELDIQMEALGATTFWREDLARGFEADSCFYLSNESRIRGKSIIDLPIDPPPDLVIEIDHTRSSLDKLALSAAMGVPEVWRDDGKRVRIYCLSSDQEPAYQEMMVSVAFPSITSDVLRQVIAIDWMPARTSWIGRVRDWVRANRNQPGTNLDPSASDT